VRSWYLIDWRVLSGYVRELQDWMAGVLNWHRETSRYDESELRATTIGAPSPADPMSLVGMPSPAGMFGSAVTLFRRS